MFRRADFLSPDTFLFHLKPKTFILIAGEASGDLLAANPQCRRSVGNSRTAVQPVFSAENTVFLPGDQAF